jgi:hypothetical protein
MKHIKEFESFLDEKINETTYIFHVYPRDEYGDHIPTKKKEVKINRASIESARDVLYKKYPRSDFFSELYSTLNEKEFSSEEREKLADKGYALPDGSFPIATVDDLKNAVHAFGRSNDEDRKKVAQHIAKRAKALGHADLIPQTDIFQKALKEDLEDTMCQCTGCGATAEYEAYQENPNMTCDECGGSSWATSVSEGAFHVALYKARNEGAKEFEFKGQKFPVHPKKGEPEMIDEEDEKVEEGVVSIKGGRILANKVLNKLVDMDIVPVKKKSEEAIEAIASVLATTSMSESLNEGTYEVHFSDGVRASKKFNSQSQAISFAKDLIKNKKGLQFVDVFDAGSGFHSTADTDAIVAWWGDGSYTDNKSKNDSKLAAKKIEESLDEAMVQVAGKNKPSGAQVLAMVIIDHMIENGYLKPGADKVKKELTMDLQKLIMDSTF